MKKRNARLLFKCRVIELVVITTICMLMIFSVSAPAEDSINLECPVFAADGSLDSVGVRVFLANDSNLANFTLSFEINTDKFVFSSARPSMLIMQPVPLCAFIWHVFSWGRRIAVAGYVPTDLAYYPSCPTPIHVFTMWFRPVVPYEGDCVDIDTCYIDNGYYTRFMVHKTYQIFYPEYNDCDSCDIAAEIIPCGDLNGSGQMDIADVIYLVNYIFSSGPAPQDTSQGDADCSSQTNIADAVYLVNYIFAGGAEPCAACP